MSVNARYTEKLPIFVLLSKFIKGSDAHLVRWFFYTPTIHSTPYRFRSRTPVRKVNAFASPLWKLSSGTGATVFLCLNKNA